MPGLPNCDNSTKTQLSYDMTKPTKSVRPAKTQISLGIRPVWSESSLSAWRKLGYLATHWAHSEDSDQTGRIPRLIWVFAGRIVTLLVLSYRGSHSFEWHLSRSTTKPTKWHVRPAKTQFSLGICPVWSVSSLYAQWVAKDPRFLHADNEDSDQTGWMLVWVFAGPHRIGGNLELSRESSNADR